MRDVMNDTITTQTFKLNATDYSRFYFVTWCRGFLRPVRGISLLVFCIALPAAITYPGLSHGHYGAFLAYVAAFSAMWLVGMPLVGVISQLNTLRKNKALTDPRVTELNPAGILVIREHLKVQLQWSQFRAVGETGTIIYLVTVTGSGLLVHKDAFASIDELQAFKTTAKYHIAAVHHKQIGVFYDEPMAEMPREGWSSPPFVLTFASFFPYYTRVSYGAVMQPAVMVIPIFGIVLVPLWLDRYKIMAGHWLAVVPTFLLFIAFLLFLPPVLSAVTWLRARKTPAAMGTRTVTLAPDRVVARGKAFDTSLAWRDIYKVTHSFGQTRIWLTPKGAIYVPDSAFPDKATALAFHAEAVRLLAAGKAAAAKSALDG